MGLAIIGWLLGPAAMAATPGAMLMLERYSAEAELPLNPARGRELWHRDMNGRSCLSCHTDSVYSKGRHERTGKVIEPMAPSVNPNRYKKPKKIEKWFLRNCKWTYGRPCTAQEKGDMLLWLSEQ